MHNQTQFSELYSSGMRAASDMLRVSLDNLRSMQARQMEAWRAAIEESLRAGEQLAQAKSMSEVMAVQTRLYSRLWSVQAESGRPGAQSPQDKKRARAARC